MKRKANSRKSSKAIVRVAPAAEMRGVVEAFPSGWFRELGGARTGEPVPFLTLQGPMLAELGFAPGTPFCVSQIARGWLILSAE